MTRYETGAGIQPGTFGLADECSTTELTLLLLGTKRAKLNEDVREPIPPYHLVLHVGQNTFCKSLSWRYPTLSFLLEGTTINSVRDPPSAQGRVFTPLMYVYREFPEHCQSV